MKEPRSIPELESAAEADEPDSRVASHRRAAPSPGSPSTPKLRTPTEADEPDSRVASHRRAAPSPSFRILYDGECPLCLREIAMLRKLDRGRGRLDCEDIAAPDFDAGRYGRTQRDLMARIHGVLPDGSVIEGVEVFRRAYAAVGLGWLVAPTRWPLLRPLADAAYRWFARNRLRLTGRGAACDSEHCAVHEAAP